MKNGKGPLPELSSHQLAKCSFTRRDATTIKGNLEDTGAEDYYDHSQMPIGEAIQVDIGIMERCPSLETRSRQLYASNVILEIVANDNYSGCDANAKTEDSESIDQMNTRNHNDFSQICSFQSTTVYKNIYSGGIWPFPLDSSHQSCPDYAKLPRPPYEERLSRKGGEEAKKATVGSKRRLCPTDTLRDHSTSCGKKTMPRYPAINHKQDQSWRNHISSLIHKYGRDNNRDESIDCDRDCRHKTEKRASYSYKEIIRESSTKKKRDELGGSDPRRSVWRRVSIRHDNDCVREYEKQHLKQSGPRKLDQGNLVRKGWSGKAFHGNDSESDSDLQEEGKIIEIDRQDFKRKSNDCRSYYSQKKIIRQKAHVRK